MAFKIYTRTGDQGQTGLFGGARVSKQHWRIEAYGTLDELNAHLGLLRDELGAQPNLAEAKQMLFQIQHRLFHVGAILATDPAKPQLLQVDIFPADVEVLEQAIDQMEAALPPLKNFVLPGGHKAVSQAHVARCVCRRAERLVVAAHEAEAQPEIILHYLNRLSDYLFVLSRYIGLQFGAEEQLWKGRS